MLKPKIPGAKLSDKLTEIATPNLQNGMMVIHVIDITKISQRLHKSMHCTKRAVKHRRTYLNRYDAFH